MADFILVDGDLAMFQPTFGPATVVPKPGKLAGSGPGTLMGKNLCVVGDEGKVAVLACTYMTQIYSVPGLGTLKIAALSSNQKAQKTSTGQKSVLLKGATFTAKLEVTTPAQYVDPATGSLIPDPNAQYSGSGTFVTTNNKFRGN